MAEATTAIQYHSDRLAESARELARQHRLLGLRTRQPVRRIGARLRRMDRTLKRAYRTLARAVRADTEAMPAAEWLLDNYYIIREQLEQVREHLPISYHRRLPRLGAGPLRGAPRIYEVVRELARSADNVVNVENLGICARAYQEEESLTIGELWAIPIMVRLVLLERLSDLAAELIASQRLNERAGRMVERIAELEPSRAVESLDRLASEGKMKDPVLLLEIDQGLLRRELPAEAARAWIRQALLVLDTTTAEQSERATRLRTRAQVSVANAVQSLRRLAHVDWSDFVESHSVVEQVLRLDPGDVYAAMDFETRNRCRSRIERISDRGSIAEMDIARAALTLAEKAYLSESSDERPTTVAWYLIGEGRPALEAELSYVPAAEERLRGWIYVHAGPVYAASTVLITVACLLLLAMLAQVAGAGIGAWLAVMLLGIWPITEVAIAVVNWLVTEWIPPRVLPKLSFEDGIPKGCETLVVIPCLIGSAEEARELVEKLEIHAIGNPDPALRFVLLSDFHDAPTRTTQADGDALETARAAVRRLNEQHADDWGDRFFVLHRRREPNPGERAWMGRERKRGKLEQVNRALRDPEALSAFPDREGRFAEVVRSRRVRYVISLDSDTVLPPGVAVDLVRTAAHPFNRPRFDRNRGIVTQGYGILQPRVSLLSEVTARTPFTRLFAAAPGLDPYTTAVSDIYQDLFGEGIYMGKGIYDVDAFIDALDGTFPENAILSHDLIESTFARAAFCSDIEVFDDYPRSYPSSARRNHRWIRGDWQLLPWLFPNVPTREGRRANPLPRLSRWKILDNLRRSLQPVAFLLLAALGVVGLAGPWWLWLVPVLAAIGAGAWASLLTALLHAPRHANVSAHAAIVGRSAGKSLLLLGFGLTVLPQQAYLSMDAIVRVIWRLTVSRRHLLQWVSASSTERCLSRDLSQHLRCLLPGVLAGFAAASAMLPATGTPRILVGALSLIWLSSPLLVWSTARTAAPSVRPLPPHRRTELRQVARRSWAYFDRFVGAHNRWLAPDNVQFRPFRGEAPRTSPTNMGLALVSMLAAYDLGFLPRSDLLRRLGEMLGSMRLLERYEGHFYNWYDTRTGGILEPHYVSTVDSGNMAACLITLKSGLEDVGRDPPLRPVLIDGLHDLLGVVGEALRELSAFVPATEAADRLAAIRNEVERASGEGPTGAEVAAEFRKLRPLAASLAAAPLPTTREDVPEETIEQARYWVGRPLAHIESCLEEREKPDATSSRIGWLVGWCDSFLDEMDMSLLFDADANLFVVGYNVDRRRADESLYDLFASEARLASFLAIARNAVLPRHWFTLSRRLTEVSGRQVLASWSGTMFEYLMPLLFTRTYPDTLLDRTYRAVVSEQQTYGRRKGHPWGISESAYGLLNLGMDYQYRAFGIPALGLKRGLAEDYVVAPYATMLALMIDAASAMDNLDHLKREGGYGPFGFFEAIDYTPGRLDRRESRHVISSYMAHHHGMSMMAMANVLCDGIMQERFHRDLHVKAAEPLLQEKVPKVYRITPLHATEYELEPSEEHAVEHVVAHFGFESLRADHHRVNLLSNGHYSVMVTGAGTGYSRCDGIALTRWRGDPTVDGDGFFVYLRDLDRGSVWSAGHQPVQRHADRYDLWFHAGIVQGARVDDWIETFLEICVSPEDNIELRRLTLTNYSDETRRIELTSFAEVVLDRSEAFEAHPAYSRLFVETDHLPEHHALLAHRRKRSSQDPSLWLVHVVASDDFDDLPNPLTFETSRAAFIGRGRMPRRPIALEKDGRLSGSLGSVLDPIASLRLVLELPPGGKQTVSFGLGLAHSRGEARALADRYDNPYAVERAFNLARVYGLVELRHLGITGRQARRYQDVAGLLLYSDRAGRAKEAVLKRCHLGQRDLWRFGISGDLPLIVMRVRQKEQLGTVRHLLLAHRYWKQKGLLVDLLIINDEPASYLEELREGIARHMDRTRTEAGASRGAVAVHRTLDMSEDELDLVQSFAHVVVDERFPKPGFDAPADSMEEVAAFLADPCDISAEEVRTIGFPLDEARDLRLDNGFGGFSADGRRYVIRIATGLRGQVRPPMPWANVVANRDFGFLVTESGAGNTWCGNSRENRLTPWSNDPVSDRHGEALYLRDPGSRCYWSPVPGPVPGAGAYVVEHGFGFSQFRHRSHELDQRVRMFAAVSDPVKMVEVRVRNMSDSEREIDLFSYTEWVLGVRRPVDERLVITEYDAEHRTVLARNRYDAEFGHRVAFSAAVGDFEHAFTADRRSFLGRYGEVCRPAALGTRRMLDGHAGAGYDPCAAHEFRLKIGPGQVVECAFLLGQAATREEALALVREYGSADRREAAFEQNGRYWDAIVSAVRIRTPAEGLDILANGWLLYQVISCRLFARSAVYQSGGAYGFRDQLQDVAALLFSRPDLAREQLLLHAAHQFETGDALHWWHPPRSRGVRTRISDDRLWLPFVVSCYVRVTGDEQVLDESVPFVVGDALEEGEEDRYLEPSVSTNSASLYEHCCLAIEVSQRFGSHGLPLIGSGDWNDGMNRLGVFGRGESVWLAQFMHRVLLDFLPICESRMDTQRALTYRTDAERLAVALERSGWDGEWYRRAYDDRSDTLGSASNREGRIFVLPQAWSVLSGAASAERAGRALDAAIEHLVWRRRGLIRLLAPPFDREARDPGYIKGYVPGVRENGGQYTHGALWLIMALAKAGRGSQAGDLLEMIAPTGHTPGPEAVMTYQVEPYVMAADVYGVEPHVGRGGWTWYTGSAAWMYRVLIESLLGFTREGPDTVVIEPSIPEDWPEYGLEVTLGDGATRVGITVLNPTHRETGVREAFLDGVELEAGPGSVRARIDMDGRWHEMRVVM